MTQLSIETRISLQNIKIYTPIDRSRRVEFKNIYFDLIWTFGLERRILLKVGWVG